MPARTLISHHSLRYLLPVAALGLVAHLQFGSWAALPWGLLLGGLVYVFRDPHRVIPSAPRGVVSAADGRVSRVDTVRVPRLDREMIRISVDMNLAGAYVMRSPAEGKSFESWRVDDSDEYGAANGRGAAFWLETDEGDDVVIVMHDAGPLRRPVCTSSVGDRLGQGQRCGYVPFGSRIDVMVPLGSRVEVQEGARVWAGHDVIATLIHK